MSTVKNKPTRKKAGPFDQLMLHPLQILLALNVTDCPEQISVEPFAEIFGAVGEGDTFTVI